MKETGIVRRIDDLGRVVIPKEIRRKLLLLEGDPLELFVQDDGIFLKKYIPDYNLVEVISDIERKFDFMVDEIGHKNNKEIKSRLKELRELMVDC